VDSFLQLGANLKFIRHVLSVCLSLFLFASAQAQESGTREEAKAMVNAAVAHVKKVGADQAFSDFSKDKANWVKKDLYVAVLDFDGVMLAHGANEKLIGKNLIGLKDQRGHEFIKQMISLAQSKGDGWVDYDWVNPVSKKVEPKASYLLRLPGAKQFALVGVYR
jgi:signal transduction histidine kinase